MNGPEGRLQRLRLWLRAYESNPSGERRRTWGAAIARYLKTVGMRRGPGGDGPVEPVAPIRPIAPRDDR